MFPSQPHDTWSLTRDSEMFRTHCWARINPQSHLIVNENLWATASIWRPLSPHPPLQQHFVALQQQPQLVAEAFMPEKHKICSFRRSRLEKRMFSKTYQAVTIDPRLARLHVEADRVQALCALR